MEVVGESDTFEILLEGDLDITLHSRELQHLMREHIMKTFEEDILALVSDLLEETILVALVYIFCSLDELDGDLHQSAEDLASKLLLDVLELVSFGLFTIILICPEVHERVIVDLLEHVLTRVAHKIEEEGEEPQIANMCLQFLSLKLSTSCLHTLLDISVRVVVSFGLLRCILALEILGGVLPPLIDFNTLQIEEV